MIILLSGLGIRVVSYLPDLTVRQILSNIFRKVCSFFLDNVISAFLSAENGFIDGLCDSLWPEAPSWSPWGIRTICYLALAHHFGVLVWIWSHGRDKIFLCFEVRRCPPRWIQSRNPPGVPPLFRPKLRLNLRRNTRIPGAWPT